MSHSSLALLNIGGGEIILLLAVLLILTLGAAAVVALVYLIVRASQKGSSQAQDLEQQLRTLAKLRDDGVITEEDFNAKKKVVLGI